MKKFLVIISLLFFPLVSSQVFATTHVHMFNFNVNIIALNDSFKEEPYAVKCRAYRPDDLKAGSSNLYTIPEIANDMLLLCGHGPNRVRLENIKREGYPRSTTFYRNFLWWEWNKVTVEYVPMALDLDQLLQLSSLVPALQHVSSKNVPKHDWPDPKDTLTLFTKMDADVDNQRFTENGPRFWLNITDHPYRLVSFEFLRREKLDF